MRIERGNGDYAVRYMNAGFTHAHTHAHTHTHKRTHTHTHTLGGRCNPVLFGAFVDDSRLVLLSSAERATLLP